MVGGGGCVKGREVGGEDALAPWHNNAIEVLQMCGATTFWGGSGPSSQEEGHAHNSTLQTNTHTGSAGAFSAFCLLAGI